MREMRRLLLSFPLMGKGDRAASVVDGVTSAGARKRFARPTPSIWRLPFIRNRPACFNLGELYIETRTAAPKGCLASIVGQVAPLDLLELARQRSRQRKLSWLVKLRPISRGPKSKVLKTRQRGRPSNWQKH